MGDSYRYASSYSAKRERSLVGMGQRSQNRQTARSIPARLTPLNNPRGCASNSTTTKDIAAKYGKFDENPRLDIFRTPHGFINRSSSEECLKCMLKIPHDKCEAHKYIRVGGGYRHSYWYCKALLEEIMLQRAKEEVMERRLDAIHERNVKTIKTYIRTKSGRLVERMIFLSEEDYLIFRKGGKHALDILAKYLSKDDMKNIDSYEKDEQKALTTWIRTKSGRRIQKTVYVSKEEYEAMKRGELDAKSVLQKYMKKEELEGLEGWGEAEMKQIKTYVRTKSGRLIEKIVVVTAEDYERMQELKRQGKDPNEVLAKYMSLENGQKVEGWKKEEAPPMKVVKVKVRTKSGRLIEQTVMMTEKEFDEFQKAGGDPNQLRKYLDIDKDAVIETWDKASTVYADSDNEDLKNAKDGTQIVGKDGNLYKVVVDPLTGKKYKKKIGRAPGFENKARGKVGRGRILGETDVRDPNERGMTKQQVAAYRAGKRRDDSDSEYSYRSDVSAGGTRRVFRKKKNADGTHGKEEAYDEDNDPEGMKRRQKRREARKQVAFKEKKKALAKGKRDADSEGSEYSYRSIVSAGGTRKVMRKKKNADGTYGEEDSYHSSQDEDGEARRKARRVKRVEDIKKGKRNADSDSDYSYRSVRSAGGTRKVLRRKKNKDGTYGKEEEYDSDKDVEGKERRRARREQRQMAFKAGKRRDDSDSGYSYRSVISAGGRRHVMRRRKRGDGTYSAEHSYHSSDDNEGEERRRRRRRERKHAGSANSYYSVRSAGGTRHVRRRRRHADGKYSDSESYHSGDSDFFKKKPRKHKKGGGPDGNMTDFSDDLQSTDPENEPDLSKMTEKERKAYLEKKATRKAEREDKRKERYGDKYEEMSKKHKFAKAAQAFDKAERMIDFSDDLKSTDSENEPDLNLMTEAERKEYMENKAQRKAEREKKRKEKYGDKYEEMSKKHKEKKLAVKLAKAERMTDFSEKSTDPEDEPDLNLMTEEERKEYLEKKAQRKAERDEKRKEKYGDKYDQMMEKHKKKKMAVALAKAERMSDFSGDLQSTDSENEPDLNLMTESERQEYLEKKAKRKVEREKKRKEKYGDKYDEMMLKHEKAKAAKAMLNAERMTDFSDDLQSTDSEAEPNLSKMTESEKKQYLEEKAKRKEEREKKRREKFGDKYEEMIEKHEKAKEAKKLAKSMVDYAKASKRFQPDIEDTRDLGPGHKKLGKKKPGNEADDEGDGGVDKDRKKKKKRITSGGSEVSVESYFETDKDGKIKLKDGMNKIDLDKLDADDLRKLGIDPTNMTKEQIARALKEKFGDAIEIVDKGAAFDDGNYFKKAEDGKLKLKDGSKKIDLSKLSADDLKAMGIDPDNMTKEEIARKLKDMFGDDIEITEKGEKFDDGDYFQIGADGKVKLKDSTKKIDISKLSVDDLKKMGIDPENLTKEEIARKLKSMFGDDVEIVDKGQEFDDGDYFEVGADGKTKLKGGKKKIDLNKLSVDDLKKLGIDPSKMTKEELARAIKEKLGADVEFTEGGKKFDDGDYFEFNPDGTVKLKKGQKKIDLSKMSKEDLRKLGIDTKYMTKEQIAKKLREKFGTDVEVVDGNESDGDYFETTCDGKIKLKAGKKKIDINKLTAEDLQKLGINPNATKEEIARALKDKFGDDIQIERDGVKIGLKRAEDFDSDADTDDLAEDSDLDISTLKGQRKVAVMMKRGGGIMQEHMLTMINQSNLIDHTHPEERDSAVDFLANYQLVDTRKIETYARAYVVEDEDLDYKISAKAAKDALEAVPSVKDIDEAQKDYVFKLLDLDDDKQLTFRMFAVMTALAERVTAMDNECKDLLRIANLTDIERKMGLYQAMFQHCVSDDATPNHVKIENLRIELMAGGLTWDQVDYVISKLQPNEYKEISFLDYLTYIPLFLSMHEKITDNPLDMSHKFKPRPLSGQQRDMNPLGHPLKTDSVYLNKRREQEQRANNLLQGKQQDEIRKQQMDMYNKYHKLPHIAHSNPVPGSKPKKHKPLF